MRSDDAASGRVSATPQHEHGVGGGTVPAESGIAPQTLPSPADPPVPPPVAPPPAAAPPAPVFSSPPAAPAAPAGVRSPDATRSGARCNPAAAQEPAGSELDGAPVALNMALNGESREQADRYLQENFQLADRTKLLDEVYAAIEV